MANAMRHPARILAVTLAPTLLVAGCAGPQHSYPSLDIRPEERAYGQVQPVTPAPAPTDAPVTPGAPVAQQIAALRAKAAAAHQRFLARKPEADRLTAAAQRGAAGSTAWSVAQVALASLESARNDTSVALTDLDSMLVAAQLASTNAPSPDLAAVQAAHDDVSRLVTEESAVVGQFAARLAG